MGIGKKLLELMIDEVIKKNVKEITLESTITAHNFYKKFGFVDIGEQLKCKSVASLFKNLNPNCGSVKTRTRILK